MKAQFIKGKYNSDKTITLYVRKENGVKTTIKVAGFEPYFYVSANSYIPNHPNLKRIENSEIPSIEGLKLKKITMQTPTDVKDFRKKFKLHYEADIPFIRRFLIDTGIKSGIELPNRNFVHYKELTPINFSLKPVVCYVDIEAYTKTRFPNPNRDKNKIIIVTLYVTNGRYYTVALSNRKEKIEYEDGVIVFVKSEEDILKFIREYLNYFNPDVITGWNVSFDVDYIMKRAEKKDLKISLNGVNVFDLLSGYKILNKKGSNALADVVYDEEIAEKINYKPFTTEFWERDEMDGIYTNISHVKAIVEIDKKHRLTDFYWGLKNYVGLEELEPTLYHGVLVDTMLLRVYHDKYVLPSKSHNIIENESKIGGLVIKPPKGIFENVSVFDMSRYYPNIIINYNISPEPSNEEIKITPRMVQDLLKEREKYEEILSRLEAGSEEYKRAKAKRDNVKYIAESVFGYFGNTSSRLYNREFFEKITTTGQEGLLYLKDLLEKKGYKTLYGDTDGIFVQLDFDEAFKIEKFLNISLKDFCQKKGIKANLKLKVDRFFDRIIFAGMKKRYAGHVIWEGGKKADYTYIVGFEHVRRDAPRLTRNLQKKIFELILKGEKQKVADLVKTTVKKFKNGEYDIDEIAIRKTLSKRLSDYHPKPDYVRGSLYANQYFGYDIRGGDMIKMIYVKKVRGLPKTDVICWIGDFPNVSIEIDTEKMIDRTIKRKVEKLLDLIGLNWENVIGGQKKLTEVFG